VEGSVRGEVSLRGMEGSIIARAGGGGSSVKRGCAAYEGLAEAIKPTPTVTFSF